MIAQLESEPEVSQIGSTPTEVPFNIPEKWKWIQLRDIASSNVGLTYKPQDISTEGTPVLRSCNIEKGEVVFTDLKRVSKVDIPTKCLIQEGDILMCSRNGSKSLVGKCALMPVTEEVFGFGAFMTVIRSPYNRYLKFYFESDYFRKTMLEANNSTSINQITQKKLLDVYIPLPPVQEQHRIVNRIQELLPLIDSAKIAFMDLQSLGEILRQRLLRLAIQGKLVPQLESEPEVTQFCEEPKDTPYQIPEKWKWVRFSSVATLLNGRAYSKSELLDKAPGRVPVLRVGNFFTNSSWYYSDLDLAPDKYCDNNDLLFAWSASFGPKIWNGGRCIYHYHIWKVVCSEYIDKEWLYLWLLSMAERLKKSQGRGSTMVHITKKDTEQVPLALPPIEEQRRIVKTVKSLFQCVNEMKDLKTQ